MPTEKILLKTLDRNPYGKERVSSRFLTNPTLTTRQQIDVNMGMIFKRDDSPPTPPPPPPTSLIHQVEIVHTFQYIRSGMTNFIKYDNQSGSIVWECTVRNEQDSSINIDRIYSIEITKNNIKKIFITNGISTTNTTNTNNTNNTTNSKITTTSSSNSNTSNNSNTSSTSNSNTFNIVEKMQNKRILNIVLHGAPKIFNKPERIAFNDTSKPDAFMKTIKNWSFCRVLQIVDLDPGHNLFRKKKIEELEKLECKVLQEIVINVEFDLYCIPFKVKFLLMCMNTKFPGLFNCKERLEKVNEIVKKRFKVPFDSKGDIEERMVNVLRDILIENSIDYENFAHLFESNLDNYQSSEPMIDNSERVYTNRITITPLCMKYHEDFELGNRVIRKYKHKLEDFIRVSFSDEMNGKLAVTFMPKYFQKHFKEIVNNGISICGKKFQMLGYSSSQLRACSAWYVSAEMNAQTIIDGLSKDFSKIKEDGKYCARVGLCFSTTHEGIAVKYKIGKDIKRNGTIFNDGSGKMSRSFAEKFKRKKNGKDYTPSALQFRMGTCKGVVQLDLNDERLNKDDISLIISENQIKVPYEKLDEKQIHDGKFELITSSERKGVANLNRQILNLLLTANNVPIQKIKELVDIELSIERFGLHYISTKMIEHKITMNLRKYYSLNTTNEDKPLKKIQVDELDHFHYHEENEQLLNCRVPYEDKFSQEILKYGREAKLKALLDFRIPVDFSCSLIGVFDYLEVLDEGEVFINLSLLDDYPTGMFSGGIVDGSVIVVKSPCLHPGDIRLLKAVTDKEKVEKLKHLQDVIVFSSKGSRPESSKMGGSDLDGDIYSMFWDSRLTNKFTQNDPYEPSGKNNSGNNQKSNKTHNFETIRSFFIKYSENGGVLGQIANKHIELSDKYGAGSEECIGLAVKFCQQVDAPKTGNFVKQESSAKTGESEKQDISAKTLSRPHYMNESEGNFIQQYHSNSLLGQLYSYIEEQVVFARADERGEVNESVDNFEQFIRDTKENDTLFKEVDNLFQSYKKGLKKLIDRYSPTSEAELIGGFVLDKRDYYQIESQKQDVILFVNEFDEKVQKFFEENEEHGTEYRTELNIAKMFIKVVQKESIKKNGGRFGMSFYWLVMDKFLQNTFKTNTIK